MYSAVKNAKKYPSTFWRLGRREGVRIKKRRNEVLQLRGEGGRVGGKKTTLGVSS